MKAFILFIALFFAQDSISDALDDFFNNKNREKEIRNIDPIPEPVLKTEKTEIKNVRPPEKDFVPKLPKLNIPYPSVRTGEFYPLSISLFKKNNLKGLFAELYFEGTKVKKIDELFNSLGSFKPSYLVGFYATENKDYNFYVGADFNFLKKGDVSLGSKFILELNELNLNSRGILFIHSSYDLQRDILRKNDLVIITLSFNTGLVALNKINSEFLLNRLNGLPDSYRVGVFYNPDRFLKKWGYSFEVRGTSEFVGGVYARF